MLNSAPLSVTLRVTLVGCTTACITKQPASAARMQAATRSAGGDGHDLLTELPALTGIFLGLFRVRHVFCPLK